MNKTIWKFELGTSFDQYFEMPEGAEILTIQAQGETHCLWVLVDPTAKKETRHFEIFETGSSICYDMGVSRNYIGTHQLRGGSYVFHVFEYTGV